MKRIATFGLALLFLLALSSGLQAAKEPAKDARFAKEAASGNMFEIEAGKLAAGKASSEDVKAFGQRMVDDHTEALDELKQIAEKKKIKLPEKPYVKDRAELAVLGKLSGAEFDKQYMATMVRDHKADVKAFEGEARKGKDEDLKGFAAKTLPTLKEHLKLAEETEGKLKKTGK